MKFNSETKAQLIECAKSKGVFLEGNILKLIDTSGDKEFSEYINSSIERDTDSRRKRLEMTKQVQQQNNELTKSKLDNIKTIALSSNTSDVHSNLADTDVWEYVYRIGVGQDPSIPVTIPFYVDDLNKYYFLDIETRNQTDNIHRTRCTNTASEAYTGSYVILRPV